MTALLLYHDYNALTILLITPFLLKRTVGG